MGVITVTNREQVNWGNLPVVVAECASIATASTWRTGLAEVFHVFVSGLTAIQAITWTQTHGTVTFTVANGPATNISLLAIGGTA